MPAWIQSLASHLNKEHGVISTRALLDILSLDGDRFENDEKGSGNHISLMTIHAAKGLEYPAVFVVGLEEEYLPHKNSLLDPQGICEERRLFYVALTRAKSRLFLSHCQERLSGYQGRITRNPSRFIKEIPESAFIATQSTLPTEAAETSRKQQISQRLSLLRSSLRAPATK
jgi:DNA helicase-2/ATP-dependent DNA helicase PcrA